MLSITWVGKAVGENKRLKWTPKRMVANKDYQAFVDDMALTLKASYYQFSGTVDVTLKVCTWKGMDSDATLKPCLDAIQRGGVLTNDNKVRNINIIRSYHKKGELDRIIFHVEEVPDA